MIIFVEFTLLTVHNILWTAMGRGVKGIDLVVQKENLRTGPQLPGYGDYQVGELPENAHTTHLIGFAEVTSRHTLAKAQVVERALVRSQCHDQVTKALTAAELPEQQDLQVVAARERLDIFVALVLLEEIHW